MEGGGGWAPPARARARGAPRRALAFAAACFAYSAAASLVLSVASLAFAAACFAYSTVIPAAPAVASLALAAACLM